MYSIDIKQTADVTMHGRDINEIIEKAAQLAHGVLEDLSVYRQKEGIDEEFMCEDEACEFLNMIGD